MIVRNTERGNGYDGYMNHGEDLTDDTAHPQEQRNHPS
jgi:hypothetical protein